MDLFERVLDRLSSPSVDAGTDAVGGGGGTPSPATSPSEPAAPSTGAPGSSSAIEDGSSDTSAPFALSDDVMYADLEAVELPSEQAPEAPVQPTQPSAAPQAAPQQAQPQQAQPQDQRPVAPQPADQQAAQPSPTQGVDPSQTPSSPQLLQMVLQNRDAILGELASKRFALSQAEQEELESNAVAAIPKMMARTYFDAYTSAIHYMNQQVPTMIATHIAEAQKDQAAESDFYSAWPGIDKSKYADDVLNFASAYRSMNPKASLKDAIQFTGSAIVAKYGLQNASRATQAAPGKTNSRGVRSAPFAPAAGGRTSVAPVVDNGNPWDGMGMNFDD